LIRLQEKILEKVDKFNVPSAQSISIVVVDCTNIHEGMLDDDDIRMALYGKTKNPEFQEYWEGVQLQGLCDPDFNRRNADLLHQRLSGIVFIPKLEPSAWDNSYIALNPAIETQKQLKKIALLSKLECVNPPNSLN